MQEAIYNPVLDALADHQPRTLGQIEQLVPGREVNFGHVMQAVIVLIGNGALYAVQDDAIAAKAKRQTDRLNAFICQKARSSGDMSYLASPVSGGGVPVARFQQLFLVARGLGRKQASELAQHVWLVLKAQGQRIVKDGKRIESEQESLQELEAQAQVFIDKQAPILKALGVSVV